MKNQVSAALGDDVMWYFYVLLSLTHIEYFTGLDYLLNHAIKNHKQYCAEVKYNQNTEQKEKYTQ